MKRSMKNGIIAVAIALCFVLPIGVFAQDQAEPALQTQTDQTQSDVQAQADVQAEDEFQVQEKVEPQSGVHTQAEVLALFKDAPAAEQDTIKNSEALIEQGKWASAWALLSQADADNSNPYVFAEKIRVALDGYLQTAMHVSFIFADVPEGEDLATLRELGTNEPIEPIDFSPATIASSMEEKGGEIPPVLSYMLGNYYYEVWKNYQGQWLLDDETVLNDGATEFERAYAYGLYTPVSLDRYSEMLVASQSWTGAKNVTLKALEADPGNLALTLRLADTYYGLGDYQSMPALADKIIADKNDRSMLANGYVVGIEAGLALSDREMVDAYLDGFENDFPDQYYPTLVRHLVAVNFGDAATANKAADAVTASFPGNPDVVRSLVSTWLSVNDPTSAFNYLNRNLAKEQPDDAYAALYFYRALLNVEVGETPDRLTQALLDISKAERYFKKSYPEGHQVFDMIKSMQKEWSDKLSEANQGNADAASSADTAASDATSAAQ